MYKIVYTNRMKKDVKLMKIFLSFQLLQLEVMLICLENNIRFLHFYALCHTLGFTGSYLAVVQ